MTTATRSTGHPDAEPRSAYKVDVTLEPPGRPARKFSAPWFHSLWSTHPSNTPGRGTSLVTVLLPSSLALELLEASG